MVCQEAPQPQPRSTDRRRILRCRVGFDTGPVRWPSTLDVVSRVRSVYLAPAVIAAICLIPGPTETSRQSPADRPNAGSQRPVVSDYVPPEVLRLTARTLRVYDVPEAHQGVAADARFFYAVDNTVLAKYEIASGQLVDRWAGPRNGLIRHLNSCLVGRRTPLVRELELLADADGIVGGSVRRCVARSRRAATASGCATKDRSRGPIGTSGGWIAGFAHYDGNGGVAFKDHTFSSVVTFDAEWRRTGGWLFPQSALERMAPDAASGGAIGPDGCLYLLGHDRPEMYVVARPSMGPTLIHIATIDLEAEGQAFSWAHDGTRTVFAIDRRKSLVRTIAIPPVTPAEAATALRFR